MINKLNIFDTLGLYKQADMLEKKIIAQFFLSKKKKNPLPPLFPVLSKLDEIQTMLGEPSSDTTEEKPIFKPVQPGIN